MAAFNLQDSVTSSPQIPLDAFTDKILAFLDQKTAALTIDEVLERIKQGGRQ